MTKPRERFGKLLVLALALLAHSFPAHGLPPGPPESVAASPAISPPSPPAALAPAADFVVDEIIAGNDDAAGDDAGPAVERARLLMESVRAASYPELRGADIRVRPFRSESDYFRTRFHVRRFLTGRRMRFFVEVNPEAFERRAPEEALRAVMAHELAHVLYFTRGKRVRLFGLVRLLSKGFSARFERRTDLEAIARGYGAGLAEYRRWLYQNVPARSLGEKRRNYFSPEEIEAVLRISEGRPDVLAHWLKRPPRSLGEILEQGK